MRQQWLAAGKHPLPVTVYRMDAFTQLIAQNNQDLTLPVTVHGSTLTEADISAKL